MQTDKWPIASQSKQRLNFTLSSAAAAATRRQQERIFEKMLLSRFLISDRF